MKVTLSRPLSTLSGGGGPNTSSRTPAHSPGCRETFHFKNEPPDCHPRSRLWKRRPSKWSVSGPRYRGDAKKILSIAATLIAAPMVIAADFAVRRIYVRFQIESPNPTINNVMDMRLTMVAEGAVVLTRGK